MHRFCTDTCIHRKVTTGAEELIDFTVKEIG